MVILFMQWEKKRAQHILFGVLTVALFISFCPPVLRDENGNNDGRGDRFGFVFICVFFCFSHQIH